tara:strand:+ start:672 stop:1541 length:870 start_codon:yes stop_codon:yes gene_type:complete
MEKIKFVKSNHIYIFASDLSNLIGKNRYRNPSEIVLKLWKNNFPHEYSAIKKELNDKKKPIALEETKQDTFKRISTKYKDKTAKLHEEIQKCTEEKDIIKMKESRQKLLTHCKDLESKDKIEIEKAILEITNTNFGTKQESKSIHIYTQLTGKPVLKIQRFSKRPLISSNKNIWFLGGKLDGILQDKTIIEVKNRMNGLFNSVREYEKIQTYAYMFIFHSKKSQIVETYLKNQTPECGIIDISFEEEYWKEIVSRILIFINYFNNFIENKKLQKELVQKGTQNFSLDIF